MTHQGLGRSRPAADASASPSLGAPSNNGTGEAKAETAATPAEGAAKPEDPASKIVKLDSFRKK